MADIIEDIKSRLDIVSYISSFVQLKKAGRNFKGCCPFHNEKTPSFVVSPEKQIWHCFGCHKGGDLFAFVKETDGVGFSEALQILADKAGLKIEKLSKFEKKDKSEKDDYYYAHELACDFFEEQLHETDDGAKVLKYLKNRGLSDETIREFRIGFAPDEYELLYPLLLKKGVKKEIILNSGFASSKGIGDDKIFDKYRARLMIPIFDYLGKICGFGGRALKDDQMPKYLNSPDNILYNKSRLLYGLSHAKKHIKDNDEVVLVEGYFDMILPYQAGIKNIVATSGTALTQDQIRIVKRLTANVITCFDTDSAGFEATKRSYFLLQNEDMNVKTVWQLDKKDPADYVVDHGEKFADVVKGAKDFVTFYIEKLIDVNDPSKLDGRRNVLKEILPIFKKMASTTKDFYIKKFAEMTGINEISLHDDIDKFKLPIDHPARAVESVLENSTKMPVDKMVLSLLLRFPEIFKISLGIVGEEYFSTEDKTIYNALLQQYNCARTQLKEWSFDDKLIAEEREKIDVLVLYAEDKYGEFSEEAVSVEFEKLVDSLKKSFKTSRLRNIEIEIKKAEEAEDRNKLLALLMEQQELLSK
ncbi:MAG: DNA primase [Candidatus Gracilibacteria bacterium]|nr:DNA primase [Candidatus Gracilibacteria bacterium]